MYTCAIRVVGGKLLRIDTIIDDYIFCCLYINKNLVMVIMNSTSITISKIG